MRIAWVLLACVLAACVPAQKPLTAEQILSAFKSAGLPVQNEIIYTADNDPNKLLGRPHQYIGKANWDDRRVENSEGLLLVTVEVFASSDNLENRRRYLDVFSKSVSLLAEYHFIHKNALLRIPHQLTPQQAAEYEKVLKGL